MEKQNTGEMRLLTAGRGKGDLGLVSLIWVSWADLVKLSCEPIEANIEHAEFMALSKPDRNRLKKKAPFVAFGEFINGKRNKDSVTSRSAAQLDYDKQTLELFLRLEECELTGGVVPFSYVGHTTRSHLDEHPRLRLMVPFSRDVTPDEYRLCIRALHSLFGAPEMDEGSLQPERLMYLPVVNLNAPFWSWKSEGNGYVDPDYLLEVAASLPEAEAVTAEKPTDLDIALADRPRTFYQKVNALAMKSFGAWVPPLFPEAIPYKQGGYRISSESLGRALEEDISIVAEGIKDFGVYDMDDARKGKRSPIDLVMEWREIENAAGAANWICEQFGVDPAALGGKTQMPAREKVDIAFVPAQEFASAQKVEWHVKHIIQKKGLVIVYGDPGSSKSFFVLDLVAHVARGLPWRGHKVKQSKVAYIAAEGVAGFGNRLAAYAKHHGIALTDLPILIRGGALDLKKEFLDISDQVNTIGDVGIVVIDTLAAVTPGANENTSEDMGRAVDAAQRIIEATGSTVILIHHTNKMGDIRGWSGVGAAVDNRIRIERKDDVRTAHIEKQKEGRDGQAFGYRLVIVELHLDADGDPVTSCAVEECTEEAPNTRNVKKERKPRVGDFETSANFRTARGYLKTLEHAIYLSPKKELTLAEAIAAIQGSLTHNPDRFENWPNASNIRKTLASLADHARISLELGVLRLPDERSDVSEAR